jgi:predicted dehydrogenase
VEAVVARSAARREQVAREYGIPATYQRYEEVLSRGDIDLVSICSPDRLHAQQALDALAAGAHVLCEKPVATTLEDAAALAKKVRETGLVYAAGHNYRFFPQFARLKALADEGTVGDLLLGESSYVQNLYDMEGLGPNYWRFADPQDFYLGGAIHNVDLLRWILGEVREVHAYATRGMPFYPLDDTYVSNFAFGDGRIGRLLLMLGARLKDRFRFDLNVYGREGALRTRLGRDEVIQDVHRLEGETPVRLSVGSADPIALQIAHVVECVRTGTQPAVGVVEGTKAVAVCLAAIRSAREGRPVTVEDGFLTG